MTSQPFLVNTFVGFDKNQDITVLNDGSFVITWSSAGQESGDNVAQYGIYGQRFSSSGTKIGGEFHVNTFATQDQDKSSIVSLVDGGFLVVWVSYVPGSSNGSLFGQRYNANGSLFGSEFQINVNTSLNTPIIANLSATGLPDGGFLVTWESAFSNQISARRYDANSTAGSEFKVNTFFQTSVAYPVVTDLVDGGWVITYSSFGLDGDSFGIAGQRYNVNGVKVGGEFLVNTSVIGIQGDSQVTALADGGFVVVWASNPPGTSSDGVFGQRFNASATKVGGEFLVSNNTDTSNGAFPEITRLNDNGFLVTWRGLTPQRLLGQRFDANFNLSGSEFQVNAAGTSEYPNASSIATLKDGRIVVAWPGNSPVNSNGSILARILDTSIKTDFGSDRKSDILWRNSNGSVYAYQMNGTSVASEGLLGTATNDWVIAGTGDFDANGKADILWRNSITGLVYGWQIDGNTKVGEGGIRTVSLDWQISGTGDFNGDGKSDILWRNVNSGATYIYQMNGLAVAGEGLVRNVSNDWKIAGTGDFNADGKSDILWRNINTGSTYVYLMNGIGVAAEAEVRQVTNDWVIEGVDDFNGDGKSDILWRNTNSGTAYIYQMNGTAINGEGAVGTVPVNQGWNIAGTGDYNGDSKADILWRNNSGLTYLWTMDGLNKLGEGAIRQVDNSWQIAAPTT
jgi:FG-GAP-like repeat